MGGEALDVDDFMARVQNDKDLFFELLDIFINDYYKKRKELEKAIRDSDYESVEHVAHFLMGSCGNISAGSLRTIFHDLEQKGKDKNIEGTEKYLVEIDQNFETLIKYIGELRVKLS